MTINAQALKTGRKRQHLSQEQLAELAGISWSGVVVQTISRSISCGPTPADASAPAPASMARVAVVPIPLGGDAGASGS